MQDTKIATPCTGVCTLDDNDEYCVGCFRDREEISGWRTASNDRRLEIVKSAENRKAALS